MAAPVTQKMSKSRAPNFVQAERSLLVDVIECFKHIIEDKRTDMVNAKVSSAHFY